MTTFKTPITATTEATPKTRVVYDFNGKIISLTDPFDLATGFPETLATDRLFIAALQNDESPNRNVRYTIDDLSFLPIVEFWRGLDHRADWIFQMQNPLLGHGGTYTNAFSGVTVGVQGYGLYQFDEPIEQSVTRPGVGVGAANSKPIHDTTKKKFGISSAKFYGNMGVVGTTGGRITLPGLTVPSATQNIFIMDMFFNVTTGDLNPAANQTLISKRPEPTGGSTIDNEFLLYFDGGAGKLRFSFLQTGQTGAFSNTFDIATISAITLDEWHHVAITNRGGSYMNGYFNGNRTGTAGAVTLYPGGSTYSIGGDVLGSNAFMGNVDNLRIIIAASGGATGYEAYYSGSTYPVPTAESDLSDNGEVRYLCTFNGVQGSSLFVTRTPSRAAGKASRWDNDGRLFVRAATAYGTCDGFTASADYGYPHGMSSGAAWVPATIDSTGLTLSSSKQIQEDATDYNFITVLQTPLAGSGGYSGSNNPFVRLFGFTGNSGGNVNFYGPTGATQDYFSIVPAKEVITSLANWVTAYTIGAAIGLTYAMTDVGGTLHSFTRNDTKNLYMDLYGWYNRREQELGDTKALIKAATTSLSTYQKTTSFSDTNDSPPNVFD